MKINEKIAKRRAELKLTLEEIAKATDVAKSTVKKWESGQIANMRYTKIIALAKVLKVDPMYLIYEDAPKIEAIELSEHEKELVLTYRSQPGMMQDAVCKLLGIDPPPLPELKIPERSRSASR